jgi:hypothetical protein
MVSTKKYPIQRIINWYYGNFCTRKCFNKEERIFDCHLKFQQFLDKNQGLMMTHKEFKDILDNDDLKICKLKPNFKKRVVNWFQFERWLKDPTFDPDKFD